MQTELEAKSLKEIKTMIQKLGFDISQSISIDTKRVYKKYGIDLDKMKESRFEK